MSPLQLAIQYMEIFYSGKDLLRLSEILTDNLEFRGPLYNSNSAETYLKELLEFPPQQMSYKIIETFQNHGSACLIYEFSKPGVSAIMAQTFTVKEGKITKILLVFDSKGFK